MSVPGAEDGCVDKTEFDQNFGDGKDTPPFAAVAQAADKTSPACISKVRKRKRVYV